MPRPHPEFHQAVHEAARTLIPYINENPQYRETQILERMTEPDRVAIFRATWEDDEGNVRVNRAWRVQFNNSIGPYKGGLRQSDGDAVGAEIPGLRADLQEQPDHAADGSFHFNASRSSRRPTV